MVLINDVKYACQACIKGHRSSGCNHTDRPLFEIRRKGRPTTQCDNCRDLRRTRKLHVKCLCDGRRDPDKSVGPVQIQCLSPSLAMNGKKAGRKIPLIPTLPNGLQDVDELSNRASSVPSEGSVDQKPDYDEISEGTEQPSTSSPLETSLMSSTVPSNAAPLRPCCARKKNAHAKSLSLVGSLAGLNVNEATVVSTSSEAAEQLTVSASSLGLSLSSPSSIPDSQLQSQTPQSFMMACLCGPACVCLDCTLHLRSDSTPLSGAGAGDDSDVVMHGVGCPSDCPSCVDCMGGAGWPVLSIDPRELSGRPGDLSRTMQGSSLSMPLELAGYDHHADSLGLDLSLSTSNWDWSMDDLEQYDEDMDAEGSPDPDYCALPSVSDSSLMLPGPSTVSTAQSSKVIFSKDLSSTKEIKSVEASKNLKDCCTHNGNGVGGSKARACCAGRASRAPMTTNQNTSSKLRL